jgi:hypothetical protein
MVTTARYSFAPFNDDDMPFCELEVPDWLEPARSRGGDTLLYTKPRATLVPTVQGMSAHDAMECLETRKYGITRWEPAPPVLALNVAVVEHGAARGRVFSCEAIPAVDGPAVRVIPDGTVKVRCPAGTRITTAEGGAAAVGTPTPNGALRPYSAARVAELAARRQEGFEEI